MRHPPAAGCSGCPAQPARPPSGPRAPFLVAVAVLDSHAWERPQEPQRSSQGLRLEEDDGPGQLPHRPGLPGGEGWGETGARGGAMGAGGQETWGLGPSPLLAAQRGQGSSLGVSGQPGGQLWGAVPRATTLSLKAWGGRWGRGSPAVTTRQATQGHTQSSAGHLWVPRAPPHGTLRGALPQGPLQRAPMGSCTPGTLPESLRAPRAPLGEGVGGPQAWILRLKVAAFTLWEVLALKQREESLARGHCPEPGAETQPRPGPPYLGPSARRKGGGLLQRSRRLVGAVPCEAHTVPSSSSRHPGEVGAEGASSQGRESGAAAVKPPPGAAATQGGTRGSGPRPQGPDR